VTDEATVELVWRERDQLRIKVERLENRISAAVDASDNDGGSASDAIQDMLSILHGEQEPDTNLCKGGCGGTAPHGYKYCPGCQEGANVLNQNAVRLAKEANKPLKEALEKIASCKSNAPGDVVDIAQTALGRG
jgi:hypothetical protein